MKGNYNDIIDIILTLLEDDEVGKSLAISGSIVPYIIMNIESKEYHSDFYILVKNKNINYIRNKIKKLSNEYDFDIISDSKKYSKEDFGFKIKYQDTYVGFFPYSIIDNILTIKAYSIEDNDYVINLKTKTIPNITKSSFIRNIRFAKNKILRIVTPEFILADKESRENESDNMTDEAMYLLNKISDESVLKITREAIEDTQIKIIEKKLVKNDKIVNIILLFIFLMLLIIAYICFKK